MFRFLQFSFVDIFISKQQVSTFFFTDTSNFPLHKVHTHTFGLLVKLFKSFTKRTNIDVINRYISHRQCTHQQLSLFDGIHTANLRTDRISNRGITRTNTQYIRNFIGHFSISGTKNGIERTGWSQFTLHLQSRNHVFILSVAITRHFLSIEHIKTGSNNYCFYMQIHYFNFLGKIDTIGRANFFASSTQGAIVYINSGSLGTTNAERNKCCFTTN